MELRCRCGRTFYDTETREWVTIKKNGSRETVHESCPRCKSELRQETRSRYDDYIDYEEE